MNWKKYTYLNTDTDTLIEISKVDGSEESLLFTLNDSPHVLLSVENVTINKPTTEKEAPMETTDTHYMTREFLESQLATNLERIKQLEEHSQKVTQRDYATAGELQGIRDAMQEWTLEALEQSTITKTDAEEIAEICGFDLVKEFELEVTVEYCITVNALSEEEAQNLIHDIDFDSVSQPEGITYLSSDVSRVDI